MPSLSGNYVNRVILDNNNQAASLIEAEDFQEAICKLLFARNTLEQFLTNSAAAVSLRRGAANSAGVREEFNGNPFVSLLDCDDLFTDIHREGNERYRVFRRAIRLPDSWEMATEREKIVVAVVCMFNTGNITLSAAISFVSFVFALYLATMRSVRLCVLTQP